MPVDASIYGQIQQPKSISPMENLLSAYKLQEANLGIQSKQREFAADDAYRKAAQQAGGDYNQLEKILAQTDPKRALELRKANTDIANTVAQTGERNSTAKAKDLEAANKRIDLTSSVSRWVMDNPSLENAHAAIDHLVTNGVLTPEQANASKSKLTPDPAAIRSQAEMLYRSGLSAKDQLLKESNQNLGGNMSMGIFNDVTGTRTQTGMQPITQSADSVASNARALQIAQMQDERARELRGDQLAKDKWQYDAERGGLVNMQTGEFKPAMQAGVPVGAKDKPLNDSQAKSLLFGSRMQEADKVLKQLASEGTTNSIPGSRAPLIGDVISSLSSENRQMLDQAKRDFMTAVLRRESGASISSGEFATADRQYFPQIGDSKKVIEQKARNRDLAIKGVLVEVPEKHRADITPPAAAPNSGLPDASAIDAEIARRRGK